ncbi:hypothetical protein DZ860_06975 [Vibrio sinensis]|uniref:ATPase dynein-related AAA domain-containing protein n=1 Tax=Vibrio sinensis TaxID=2302434 RepID=A0A3A6QVG5_9VIBR|nr:hypothetical protein [Vibrio sinensis]RJX72894.1 hypothetical protein DZ860_06975 [Vibrio sinensis]
MHPVDFIDKIHKITRTGRAGEQARRPQYFTFPNQGQSIEQLIDVLHYVQNNCTPDNETLKRRAGYLKNLGFLKDERVKSEEQITKSGHALLSPCFSGFRLIQNQIKKWKFPLIWNAAGKSDGIEVYPYWITLEFLLKIDGPISVGEYILFATSIKNRSEIDDHIALLKANRVHDFKELNEVLTDASDRFTSDSWNLLIGDYQYFEYVTYDKSNKNIRLSSEADLGAIQNQITAFYSIPEKDSHYYDFLYNMNDEDSLVFPAEKSISSDELKKTSEAIENDFPYKNLLLKGVPGTGKSRYIEEIILDKIFKVKDGAEPSVCLPISDVISSNVLRINIHSATSNSDLMQGISVNTNPHGQIEYSEKQGLILNHIIKAILNPSLPFVIVLEEIQENELNKLIGDLIFLIEESRRVCFDQDFINGEKSSNSAITELVNQKAGMNKVNLPSLVSNKESITLTIPQNLYFLCTSNYRDDKKIMGDNLLRRFEVIEIYPSSLPIIHDVTKVFFDRLNVAINSYFTEQQEVHPDRFQVGHAIWIDVNDAKTFARALVKLIVDFKDIKDIAWEDFMGILEQTLFFNNEIEQYDYAKLTSELQRFYFFDESVSTPAVDTILKLFDTQG